MFDFVHLGAEFLPVVQRQAEQFTVFDAIHKNRGRALPEIRLIIGNSPIFYGKLENVFFTVGFGAIGF